MDKVVTSAPAAIADVSDGSMLAVGRYGLCKLAPEVTLDEVRAKSGAELHVRDHPSDLLGAGQAGPPRDPTTSRRAGPGQAAGAAAPSASESLAHGATPAARRTRVLLEMADPAGGKLPTSKLRADAAEALKGLMRDGLTLAVGGFGLSGIPADLIDAVRDSQVRDLTIVSNNIGVDGKGLGVLLENGQIRRVIASYVGENDLFAAQYLAGELEVEFTPQGTLAERLRAGGAGIPAFYTKTGVGTLVAEGKPLADFDGQTYVLERGIVADVALVHAYLADTEGNLVYRHTARNFNPLVATAGTVTIAEAELIVEPGQIDPNHVVTPGVYVQRLVHATDREKYIEQRTVRQRTTATATA